MTNKYLEKVAASYQIDPSKHDKKYNGVKSLSLNGSEMARLQQTESDNFSNKKALGHAAIGAGVGAYLGHRGTTALRRVAGAHTLAEHGPGKFVEFGRATKGVARTGGKLGAIIGGSLAVRGYAERNREKALEDSGFTTTRD